MKGLKNFLPLLLLAMATRAIPLPEPRSIAIVSAHDDASAVEEGAFDKREIRGDLDTAETDTVTALPVETEEDGESNDEPEKEMESPEEEAEEEDADEMKTTESPGDDAHDEDEEEEMKPEEEKEETDAEDESKAEEEQPTTEEAKTDEAEPEPANEKKSGNVPEEEKVDGRIGEVDKHDSEEGMQVGGHEEDAGVTPVLPEEGPVFAIGHPVQGPFPWAFPLPLDLPVDGFPDHPVQQVGNEVQPQQKVFFPIYLIRIDPRFLQEPSYQAL